MACNVCGGTEEERNVTIMRGEVGEYRIVKNVPAKVCTQCGERSYSRDVVEKLLKFAKGEFEPMDTVSVPMYDFGKSSKAKKHRVISSSST